ncbi:unnamed protein product [Withania somnifera]
MERGVWKPNVELAPACPRCGSTNTKFCYYNNYSLTQPRYFCKGCRRYWTKGGSLRNVPVGGGCRKSRRGKSSSSTIHQHGLISRNLGNGVATIDPNQSTSNSLDHHGPSIDLALVYSNFLNSNNSKLSQPEEHQNLEMPDDFLLPNQEGVFITPSFEFSSMEYMMTSNLGHDPSRSIGDVDGVGVYIHEEKQIMNHGDVHDGHYSNNRNVINANNIINHDPLDNNNYRELLTPLPGEEMIWSNSHDHEHPMAFPNDILNTCHDSSDGGRLEAEPELTVQDPSDDHSVKNANDGSLFSLSNFGNIFRP